METVITGSGIIGPKFSTIERFTEILKKGEDVLQEETFHDKTLYVGRVKEEDIRITSLPNGKRYPKAVQFLLHACQDAIKMAMVKLEDYRVAVVIGSSGGVISEVINHTKELAQPRRASPFTIGNMNAYSLSSSVCAAFQLNGMSFTLANSCTSGMDALHLADILLKSNQADICIVGGTDATVCETLMKGFLPLKVLQVRKEGEAPYGPFSGGKGFSMSEGAGVIIVERQDIASQREAKVLGVVRKTSMTQDALSLHQTDPAGGSLLKAVDECIGSDIPTYINSQGLGIKKNDDIEAYIYEKRFNKYDIPITSIKGMVGHSMGASGMFQVISSLVSMENHFIPPTISSEKTHYPKLPIRESPLQKEVQSVLITSQGYGGSNSCTFISKGGK
ncbi:beta-ketoacyl synthase N-terminal-like domain-containing protein [Rossellomorea sp. BNER]|uniref:beta-ketoacyl synthase N-terminal-like domain-containing protein n=1 Tax=Rossellomorea sp. BNER TaxID=2962031 RepID=UPI003AF1EC36|nr:hypothetical protein [Rossellomorea sp. BNER]